MRPFLGFVSLKARMMKKIILALPLIVTFQFLVHAQAAVENKSAENMVMCRNQKVVRTIRIEQIKSEADQSGQCVTTYTKAGVDKEVGRGSNYSSCERVMENIKNNLESANWKCKGISNATFTKND